MDARLFIGMVLSSCSGPKKIMEKIFSDQPTIRWFVIYSVSESKSF